MELEGGDLAHLTSGKCDARHIRGKKKMKGRHVEVFTDSMCARTNESSPG